MHTCVQHVALVVSTAERLLRCSLEFSAGGTEGSVEGQIRMSLVVICGEQWLPVD